MEATLRCGLSRLRVEGPGVLSSSTEYSLQFSTQQYDPGPVALDLPRHLDPLFSYFLPLSLLRNSSAQYTTYIAC